MVEHVCEKVNAVGPPIAIQYNLCAEERKVYSSFSTKSTTSAPWLLPSRYFSASVSLLMVFIPHNLLLPSPA
jgi:hypothetical protein